ncbi:MAG TPA: tRNA (adenosine(37)-N6)-dimethylallyltransferase MiaA [Saprospiraceae bacterium]|nr:tRNA (adenosine(37)-N6)-dimethylallyltransferase MiaA [Saprospiraceae bacterium]
MHSKHLIVIGGATATGKTAFAIRAALHFQTEILSSDSRQFYKEMNIGTAKPTEEELAAAPHHFISHLSIHQPYSVGDFEREALACLHQIFETRDVAVMTGGSGLYIKAVCEGLNSFPEVPESIRAEVQNMYDLKGIAALQDELKQADPDYFVEVDTNNPARLLRAVAVCRAAGRPFSSFRNQPLEPRSFQPVYVQLDWPRAALYERIDQRVTQMMELGLEDEARDLYPHRHLQALQTVGYQELFDYFDNKTNLDEAVQLIRQHSRNYAKRQLTWFRRDGFWRVFQPAQWEDFLHFVDGL